MSISPSGTNTKLYHCKYGEASCNCWAASTREAGESTWVALGAPDPMCVDAVAKPEPEPEPAIIINSW